MSGITKSYGARVLLGGATFVAGRGERVGLIGRNGSGKSTLFRIILGQESADSGVVSTPSGYRVGYLDQHIRMTGRTVLEEGSLGLPHSEDGRDETYRLKSILHGLGFTDDMMEADPRSLSGGFQVRLNLAKALVAEPDLLLLDEPTNYLDIVSMQWLAGFLRQWPRELIIITHHREFMDQVTTHTMAIHRGKVIKNPGGTEKLMSAIEAEEEHYEKTRQNEQRRIKEAERFIDRFRAQATRARAVQSRIKALRRMGRRERLVDEKLLEFRFREAPFIGKWNMEIAGLGFAYPGGNALFSGLSLRVEPGDRIGVIGRNGAGKSTLLRVLAGELKPTHGNARINEKCRVAYFGQTNVDRLRPELSIVEEIMSVSAEITPNSARSIAGAMLFEGDEALKKIRVLSGGERARVLLGKLLCTPANVLILDEPTNHLDMQSVDSLLMALDAFSGTVIIVTHSAMVLDAVASRLVVFDHGGAEPFEGAYSEFLVKRPWQTGSDDAALPRSEPVDAKASLAEIASLSQQGSRKAKRQDRARLIQERSRVLGPLAARMAELEAAIAVLEDGIVRGNEAMAEASASGDTEAIARLAREAAGARKKADGMFLDLEAASAEHDRMRAHYEGLLGQ